MCWSDFAKLLSNQHLYHTNEFTRCGKSQTHRALLAWHIAAIHNNGSSQIATAGIANLGAQHTSLLCCDKLILADIGIRIKTPCIIQLYCRSSCVWAPATSSALTAFLGNAKMSCWSAHVPSSNYKCQGDVLATGPTTVFLGTQNTAPACAHAHSKNAICQ